MAEFGISQVAAAGGTLGICPIPGRNGDYAGDLVAILRWGPALVLTMTTTEELHSVGAGRLGGDLESHRIAWRHLPIADFNAPGAATAALWPAAAQAARVVLHEGGRVLTHCRGGCGRSGMAALRLMLEVGEPPETALQRLRAARPCAVETDAQLAWARGAV